MSGLGGVRPRLIDAAFAAGWTAVPRLGRPLAASAFDAVGTLSAMRPGSYEQLRRNLRQVVGDEVPDAELESLVRRGVRSYTRYWREAFQLPRISDDEVAGRTELIGFDNVTTPMSQGRGVVVALTHSGNWDAAAVILCKVQHIAMTTVAERLKPESLYERFKAYRESLGMNVVPLTGGDEPSAVALKRVLKAGEMITLLGDRDLQGNGIEAELCGARTTMPTGPALLALQTGAALVPLELSFTEHGWRNEYHPEIVMPSEGRLRDRVTAGIEQLASQFTDQIRRAPHDWHMMQKIWPTV